MTRGTSPSVIHDAHLFCYFLAFVIAKHLYDLSYYTKERRGVCVLDLVTESEVEGCTCRMRSCENLGVLR